mmetsp:Transcript_37292/g.67453  ORF Transcript_37292/g.67453 Transcript_37292/m.67453 type:complete len:93 (+) Transcript_37292:2-280(+)
MIRNSTSSDDRSSAGSPDVNAGFCSTSRFPTATKQLTAFYERACVFYTQRVTAVLSTKAQAPKGTTRGGRTTYRDAVLPNAANGREFTASTN